MSSLTHMKLSGSSVRLACTWLSVIPAAVGKNTGLLMTHLTLSKIRGRGTFLELVMVIIREISERFLI